ncbi:hypothetical protein SLEP1_g1017 [Rubroshorea leprosula]|uniref:NADP-dependent oxidoreductase domain-containing protein n=1 Tax=Rubroshorea leprosula TaxID=152421 RepID=A0AAV5HL66_9ROSI|nr:hypothetical protein SLEP1_g1017 [Rubroshorea leprosula]
MSPMEDQVPRVKLGNQGLEVSKLDFGCNGLTGAYGVSMSEEEGISIIRDAFNKGITLFDTADVHGAGANEIMIGKIATKFGMLATGSDCLKVCGRPEYVRSCCEASLKRLDLDYIDLFYQHRVDQSVSIEDTELKRLVEDGKISTLDYVWLVQTPYAGHMLFILLLLSKWNGLCGLEMSNNKLFLFVGNLGYIGIVCYGPLFRGFFLGRGITETAKHPRFTGENLVKNKVFYERVVKLVEKHGCSSAQFTLSWLHHQGKDVVPIPGTTKIGNWDNNVGSLRVKFTAEELEEITAAVAVDDAAGTKVHETILLHD